MKTIHPNKQTGSSLVVVMSVLATLMAVVAVAAEYTWTLNRHVQRSNTLESAIAVGDSCIELLFSNWRRICTTPPNQTTPLPTSSFTSIALPTSTQFPGIPGFGATATDYYGNGTANPPTVSNYKVVAANAKWQPLAGAGAMPIPMLGQIAAAITAVDATTALAYNYVASADVTLPALGSTGTVVTKIRRVFQKQQISPWNFAIFYVDPLEIHPGAPFTVTGWVHTNSDLYTGHDNLTFGDKVTYGSDWFTNFMTPTANPRSWVDSNGVTQYAVPAPGDTTHPEDPTAPNFVDGLPPARDQALQPFGLDSTAIFNLTDANPNNDSYRELIEPPTASPDPLSASRYWDQAGVVIQVNNSNNITIGIPHINTTTGVADGIITPFTSLLAPPGSGGLPTGSALRAKYQALSDMFNTSGAITTDSSSGIQDDREGGPVRLVTLDLSKIQNGTGGLNPTFKANSYTNTYFNGIVYIYDNSATTHSVNADGSINQNPTSSVRRGVRLKNGSKISAVNPDGRPTGLTVVSPNPVYIQGDYNTGRNYVSPFTNPPSNNATSDPTQPQVSGYTRAACSVLADAVTILSNSWLDSAAGNTPAASNTTVNTAIIAGIVPTNAYGQGNYSGGAENFPRFLESWKDKKFTYYGSMVELYKSQQSIAKWQYDGVYEAPDRQWYFDTNFRTTPPPGSIMVYSYIKGKWSVL